MAEQNSDEIWGFDFDALFLRLGLHPERYSRGPEPFV